MDFKQIIIENLINNLTESSHVWFDTSNMKPHVYDHMDKFDPAHSKQNGDKSIYRHAADAEPGDEHVNRPDHHIGVPSNMKDLHAHMVRNGAKRIK